MRRTRVDKENFYEQKSNIINKPLSSSKNHPDSSKSSFSPRHHGKTLFFIILVTFFTTIIYFHSPSSSLSRTTTTDLAKRDPPLLSSSPPEATTSSLRSNSDPEKYHFTSDGVTIENGFIKVRSNTNKNHGADNEISYYHCGPKYNLYNLNQEIEILLLHGAKYSKKDWLNKGVLQKLCVGTSVTAVDVDLSSNNGSTNTKNNRIIDLFNIFNSLIEGGVISGKPLTIVTPSESGNIILTLAKYAKTIKHAESKFSDISIHEGEYLDKIVHTWIPIATYSVLDIMDDALDIFKEHNIPILSINADTDMHGKEVTRYLVKYVNAYEAEISGGHDSCYLDNPYDFSVILFDFLEKIPR